MPNWTIRRTHWIFIFKEAKYTNSTPLSHSDERAQVLAVRRDRRDLARAAHRGSLISKIYVSDHLLAGLREHQDGRGPGARLRPARRVQTIQRPGKAAAFGVQGVPGQAVFGKSFSGVHSQPANSDESLEQFPVSARQQCF